MTRSAAQPSKAIECCSRKGRFLRKPHSVFYVTTKGPGGIYSNRSVTKNISIRHFCPYWCRKKTIWTLILNKSDLKIFEI